MPSPLEEYSLNYGAKLRAALNGDQYQSPLDPTAQQQPGSAEDTSPLTRMPQSDDQKMAGQGAYVPEQDQTIPQEPGGSADPSGGEDMGGPQNQTQESPLEKPGGYTFRQMWKDAPSAAKKDQVDKLEEALKKGNETIDSAYDQLEKQLGTPPAKEKSLSRQEKGMLLMEFGLNVLANNKKGFGAIGAAGGTALQHYQQQREQPYKDYRAQVGAIEGARAGAKAKLAGESALARVKGAVKDPAAAKLPGKFVGDDGYVYFYDENNQVQQAKDEQGKPIKAAQRDRVGEQGKEFESDSKYNRYMEIYGIDQATGKPLSGVALQKVKQDALDFANDRGKTLDDLDLDLQAEKSADQWMHDNAQLFENLTPEQLEKKRDEIADARRRRLKRKVRSPLENMPPTPAPGTDPSTRGRAKKRFASEADAKAAFDRGDIQVGDTIVVNGVEGPVE